MTAGWLVLVAVTVCAVTGSPATRGTTSLPRAAQASGRGNSTERDIALEIECGQTELEFGKALPLTITRTWSKALVPEALDLAAWTPLVLTEVTASRREDATHVEETARYRCQAFTHELPALPPLVFRARTRDGTEIRVVRAPAPALRIRPSAESRPQGPAELPDEFFAPLLPWRRTAVLIAIAALTLGWYAWHSRRRGLWPWTRPAPAGDGDPRGLALQRLRTLRATDPRTPAEVQIHYGAVVDVVRECLELGSGIGAPHLTSQQLLAAAAASPTTVEFRERLARFLRHCDLVRFAHQDPTEGERAALLDDAEALVR